MKYKTMVLAISLILAILISSCNGGGSGSAGSMGDSGSHKKVYQYQSARVIYDTRLFLDFGSLGSSERIGTETLIFRDWGNEEVKKSESITTLITVEGTTTETEREFEKWLTPKRYTVKYGDEEIDGDEKILVFDYSEALEFAETNQDELKPILSDVNNLFEKVGTDEVLKVPCDILKLGDNLEVCMHGNIALRVKIGDDTTKIATKIDFDVPFNDSEFELPDYPVVDFSSGETIEDCKPEAQPDP